VKHLEQHPLDTEARENLAIIYADHYRRLDLATDQLEQLIQGPNQPAKLITHWLNLLADLQIRGGAAYETVRDTLQRIVDRAPNLAAAELARHRLALLKLERRLPHRQAALCQELQAVAARAYVIGAPKGYDFSISDGLISQIRSVNGFQQYQLSCPISPGNSGGPILNNRGEVIGIASWTKADAQNVSFAIPTQEFMRLNVSQRPRTWEELAAIACSTPPARTSELDQGTDIAPEDQADARSLAAFQSQLNLSAGKSVTVVLQEESRTNTFTFTVKQK
jgi:hypothetical protein